MPWGKKKPKAKSAQAADSTIYFAVGKGISETGEGLLSYRCGTTEDRNEAIRDVENGLKIQGFNYHPKDGLVFLGKNEEDAKNKLLSQKNNIITENSFKRIEEEWLNAKKAKLEKSKKGKSEKDLKEIEKKVKELAEYEIPEELKKKLTGKTAIEVAFGIKIDYDSAVKELYVWK